MSPKSIVSSVEEFLTFHCSRKDELNISSTIPSVHVNGSGSTSATHISSSDDDEPKYEGTGGQSGSNPVIIDLTAQDSPTIDPLTGGDEEIEILDVDVIEIDMGMDVIEIDMGIDVIEIDEDSDDASEGTTISHMDEEFPNGLNATRQTNLVVIENLPSYIPSRDLTKLLRLSGFPPSKCVETK